MRRRRLHPSWSGGKKRAALLIAAGALLVLFAPATGHPVVAAVVVIVGFVTIGIGVFRFQGPWSRPVPMVEPDPADDDPDALAG